MWAPITLLAIISGLLGIYTFVLDPALQHMAPLFSWSMEARIVHDGIPAALVATIAIIIGLTCADLARR
jgi:hypothetical protein